MQKSFTLYTLIMFVFVCVAQTETEVINITDKETWDYWGFDLSKMPKTDHNKRPNTELYGGAIQFKYSFLIDVDGRPKDFKFISAEPKSAEVEQDKVRRLVLFNRYIRNPDSKYKGATRVHADEKWWTPDPSTVSF